MNSFKTFSPEDTKKVGACFGAMLHEIFNQLSPAQSFKNIHISLQARPRTGKSTFSHAFLDAISSEGSKSSFREITVANHRKLAWREIVDHTKHVQHISYDNIILDKSDLPKRVYPGIDLIENAFYIKKEWDFMISLEVQEDWGRIINIQNREEMATLKLFNKHFHSVLSLKSLI